MSRSVCLVTSAGVGAVGAPAVGAASEGVAMEARPTVMTRMVLRKDGDYCCCGLLPLPPLCDSRLGRLGGDRHRLGPRRIGAPRSDGTNTNITRCLQPLEGCLSGCEAITLKICNKRPQRGGITATATCIVLLRRGQRQRDERRDHRAPLLRRKCVAAREQRSASGAEGGTSAAVGISK